MRWRTWWAIPAAVILTTAWATAKAAEPSDLTVHEWGTFLSVQGSDGVTLDGMYHEEHALPGFVHARSRDQLFLPSALIKGETPVIYFYTGQKRNVNVHVGFPSGIWTQWYPQAGLVGPRLEGGGSPGEQRDGHITWWAEVDPHPGLEARLPATAKDSLWNYARDVDAAWVSAAQPGSPAVREYERFLFYRGLGQAALPLEGSATAGGTLKSLDTEAQHLFIVRVENGKGAYRYVPRLGPGESLKDALPSMAGALPLADFTAKVGDELAERLTDSGLYAKEARAMVNTWRESYLRTGGIRVLWTLPRSWTDRFIPMKIDPQPRQLVRVMVGRLELLTPERERRAEGAVKGLSAADASTREISFQFLRDQGRYVEPVIRRVANSTQDQRTKTLCSRLLLTDWVTELRTAVNEPLTGRRTRSESGSRDACFARAQLASLLRQVGLNDEAAAEGKKALGQLSTMKLPALTESVARHYLRGYARAAEGVGDEAGAVEWYGKFIRFGSQVKAREGCVGCHGGLGNEAPTNMAFFRDWWAGKRYAEHVERLGRTETAIRENEDVLRSRPDDAAAQLSLAYLYGARGEKDKAEQLWARLAPGSPVARR
jgi:tetratricopeptide (TPR) repeat protein